MPRQTRRSVSPLEAINHLTRSFRSKASSCRLCRKNHSIRRCLKFKHMNVAEKLRVVKRHKYCENCLDHTHLINRCRNSERCRHCGGRHHTLLHRHARLRSSKISPPVSNGRIVTLLPTIILKMELGGEWSNVRGILNACEEVSSMARFLVERYKLPTHVSGTDRWCKIRIRPRHEQKPVISLKVKVVNDLPRKQPKETIDKKVAEHFANLRLSDPHFYKKDDINIILGADIYPSLIKSGIQPNSVGFPMAQDTVLGWTIIGHIDV